MKSNNFFTNDKVLYNNNEIVTIKQVYPGKIDYVKSSLYHKVLYKESSYLLSNGKIVLQNKINRI